MYMITSIYGAVSMTGIIIAAVIVGIVGILCGILLGAASEAFKVEMDERESQIREALPGNNCGGCGYAGCDALATAIVSGEAKVNQCPVGGEAVGEIIASIMGVTISKEEKKVAFVRCEGTCDKAKLRYNYYGISDCNKISVVPGGGDKGCTYGCLGYGSCVKTCKFDAIHVVDGIAVVDRDKCVACGACMKACPKHIIEIVPVKSQYIVSCISQDKGKDVKEVCEAGCIGCTLCIKQCENDAIHMEGNVAKIDYDKCINCGKCAKKCSAKVIVMP